MPENEESQGLPEFARWINPLLVALGELGGTARPREVVDRIAANEQVSDALLDQVNPAGGQRFSNQVHWARYYLAEGGFLDSSRRGIWKLSDPAGSAIRLSKSELVELVRKVQAGSRLREPEAMIAERALAQGVDNGALPQEAPEEERAQAPEESISEDYRAVVLRVLQGLSASGFERLCQRILREAGFQQVVVTGRSNDGGIDGHGILSVNHLVGFRVLFQCKRYAGSVAPNHVRDFRGAMQGRADKGLILTTGVFTAEARREAIRDGAPPIELVDGERLIELLAQLELGLRPVKTFEVDDAFFAEYR
jgi:restriction system protein